MFPLQAKSYDINGVEHLEIWCNGEKTVVPAPVKPYFYSTTPLMLHCTCYPPCSKNCVKYTVETDHMRILDSLEEIPVWKYSFDSVDEIRAINRQLKKDLDFAAHIRENHLPFIERVTIDDSGFFASFDEKLENKLTLDIETLSRNGVYFDDIIAISLNHNGETWCITGDEKDILEQFYRHLARD